MRKYWALDSRELARVASSVYAKLPGVKDSNGLIKIPRRELDVALAPTFEERFLLDDYGYVVPYFRPAKTSASRSSKGCFC